MKFNDGDILEANGHHYVWWKNQIYYMNDYTFDKDALERQILDGTVKIVQRGEDGGETLENGDRVVYHYPAGDQEYLRKDDIWYYKTELSDENILSDIKSGYAEKLADEEIDEYMQRKVAEAVGRAVTKGKGIGSHG